MSWVLPIILAIIVLGPFLVEAMRPRMNTARRHAAPGDFVTLSRGITYFRWFGPSGGPVAVCVHGLTTPSFVWGAIAQGLTKMGFRVLVYDLYGRGYSDRPRDPQDDAFFVAQLHELLETQNIKSDVTLLGYSMGGAIATAFAARYPDRLRRLVLLAPAGLGHDLGPIARLVTNHKWLGKWLMMAWYGRSYRQALEAERGIDTQIEGIVDLQMAELDLYGFRGAVMASMRDMLDREQEEEHRLIAREAVPVLAIWGREDDVIPITGLDKLTAWNSAARQEVIDGAGHALAYTHSDKVLHAMRDLLDARD